MAELEMLQEESIDRAVARPGAWQILRVPHRWEVGEAEAGGRAWEWPVDRASPAQNQPGLHLVSAAEPIFDRRALVAELRQVLTAWRAVDRTLERMVVGSRAWLRAGAEVALLRATHHRLFLAVSQPSAPSPASQLPRSEPTE